MVKKLFLGIVLSVLVGQSLVSPSMLSAQDEPSWWAPTHAEFNDKVNNPAIPDSEIYGERYTHAQVYWIVYSMLNLAFGDAAMECAADGAGQSTAEAGLTQYHTCLLNNGITPPVINDSGETTIYASRNRDWGIFALASMSDRMMSTKPASGVRYINYVANNIVGIPEANAQVGGFGFNALQPLQSIWIAARNAAYALMTLAVVILAFMIMFRTKISPQASVTVQSAIPRVIIGLILITFSFAMAGLIIDFAYVIQGIVVALVTQSTLITDGQQAEGAVSLFNRVNDVTTGLVSYGLVALAVVLVLAATLGPALAGVTGGLSVVAGTIMVLVVLIVFIIALIKIFFLLLKTYVMIIFHIIAMPLAALGYVATPSANPFMQVMRSFIGHVSVFVTISIVVMFAHLVFWNMSGGVLADVISHGVPGELFNPYGARTGGFTSSLGLPAFTGVDTTQIAMFVGLIILIMSTSIANAMKDWITTGRFVLKDDTGLYQFGAFGAAGFGLARAAEGKGIPGAGILNAPADWILRRRGLGPVTRTAVNRIDPTTGDPTGVQGKSIAGWIFQQGRNMKKF